MKRYAKRLARRRKIALRRAASKKSLEKRAHRSSRNMMKRRFTSKKSGKLSYGERSRVEMLANKRKTMTKSIGKRLVKHKRTTDINRRRGVREDKAIDRLEGTKKLTKKYKKDTPNESFHITHEMLESIGPDTTFFEFVQHHLDEGFAQAIINESDNERNLLATMHLMHKEKGDKHSLGHYANTALRMHGGKLSARELAAKYEKTKDHESVVNNSSMKPKPKRKDQFKHWWKK